MNYQINITEASVYVGTYAKYNKGSLSGKWLDLSDYEDKHQFYKACKELHLDEPDPEFMFQDHENIPESLIDECWMSDNVFDVLKALTNLEENIQAPFLIWCDNGHKNLSEEDINDLINNFLDEYMGEYDSEEDFVRELIDEREDLSDFAKQYLDYEAYANDLFSCDYWSHSGYIFIIS